MSYSVASTRLRVLPVTEAATAEGTGGASAALGLL